MGKIKLDDFSHIQLYTHPEYTLKRLYTLYTLAINNSPRPAQSLFPTTLTLCNPAYVGPKHKRMDLVTKILQFMPSSQHDTNCCWLRMFGSQMFFLFNISFFSFFAGGALTKHKYLTDLHNDEPAHSHTLAHEAPHSLCLWCALYFIFYCHPNVSAARHR